MSQYELTIIVTQKPEDRHLSVATDGRQIDLSIRNTHHSEESLIRALELLKAPWMNDPTAPKVYSVTGGYVRFFVSWDADLEEVKSAIKAICRRHASRWDDFEFTVLSPTPAVAFGRRVS